MQGWIDKRRSNYAPLEIGLQNLEQLPRIQSLFQSIFGSYLPNFEIENTSETESKRHHHEYTIHSGNMFEKEIPKSPVLSHFNRLSGKVYV